MNDSSPYDPYRSSRPLWISDLLRDQARRIPGSIAIAAPGRPSLTYARLWSHAAEVVRRLNSLGI
ncbi:MAG: hypothetical protein ACREP8_09010, partial [Candidatus Binatia bacterium]